MSRIYVGTYWVVQMPVPELTDSKQCVCGAELQPDWRFCPKCGAGLKREGAIKPMSFYEFCEAHDVDADEFYEYEYGDLAGGVCLFPLRDEIGCLIIDGLDELAFAEHDVPPPTPLRGEFLKLRVALDMQHVPYETRYGIVCLP
jgi:hypothetical protein